MSKENILKTIIDMLKSTLGDMPADQADIIVSNAILMLEQSKISPDSIRITYKKDLYPWVGGDDE